MQLLAYAAVIISLALPLASGQASNGTVVPLQLPVGAPSSPTDNSTTTKATPPAAVTTKTPVVAPVAAPGAAGNNGTGSNSTATRPTPPPAAATPGTTAKPAAVPVAVAATTVAPQTGRETNEQQPIRMLQEDGFIRLSVDFAPRENNGEPATTPNTTARPPATNSTATTPLPQQGKFLGDSCNLTAECRPQYTTCENNVCKCRESFQARGSRECIAQNYNCPWGKALPGNGTAVTVCKTNRNVKNEITGDNCPKGSYCYEERVIYYGNDKPGHCCPLPPPSCPVGLPNNDQVCSGAGTRCDATTHFCHKECIFPGRTQDVCCPRICPNGQVPHTDGLCYKLVGIGGVCVFNDQCINGASCVSGKCTCPKGFINLANNCTKVYCPGDLNALSPIFTKANPNEVARCTTNLQCAGSGEYCHTYYGSCCPIPPYYCRDSNTFLDAAVGPSKTCNILSPGNTCSATESCVFWYSNMISEVAANSNSIQNLFKGFGLCCPRKK